MDSLDKDNKVSKFIHKVIREYLGKYFDKYYSSIDMTVFDRTHIKMLGTIESGLFLIYKVLDELTINSNHIVDGLADKFLCDYIITKAVTDNAHLITTNEAGRVLGFINSSYSYDESTTDRILQLYDEDFSKYKVRPKVFAELLVNILGIKSYGVVLRHYYDVQRFLNRYIKLSCNTGVPSFLEIAVQDTTEKFRLNGAALKAVNVIKMLYKNIDVKDYKLLPRSIIQDSMLLSIVDSKNKSEDGFIKYLASEDIISYVVIDSVDKLWYDNTDLECSEKKQTVLLTNDLEIDSISKLIKRVMFPLMSEECTDDYLIYLLINNYLKCNNIEVPNAFVTKFIRNKLNFSNTDGLDIELFKAFFDSVLYYSDMYDLRKIKRDREAID